MADVTQANVAALCYEACKVVAEHPEGIHFRLVFEEVASRYPIPGTLLEPNSKQPSELRFHNVIGWGTVDEVKAGWLVKDGSGIWRLTDEGRAAMDRLPSSGPFQAEAARLYREWDKRRKDKTPRVWIEKTRVRNRADRNSGGYALGKALWSPKQNTAGGDVYRFMRDVQMGDTILHLTDNEGFTGVSRAAGTVRDLQAPPPNTEWSDRPCFMVPLEHFKRLGPPLLRQQFFEPPYKERLQHLIEAGEKNLFFNKEPSLNQGAYLTPCPPALAEILSDAYRDLSGRELVNGTDEDESSVLERYKSAFRSLRTEGGWAPQFNGKSPYKPLLLLAVMDLLAQGTIASNCIERSASLAHAFDAYWKRVVSPFHAGQSGGIRMPFDRLQTDGFWHLEGSTGVDEGSLSESNDTTDDTAILTNRRAELDEPLYALMQDPAARVELREVLIDTYLGPEAQKLLQASNLEELAGRTNMTLKDLEEFEELLRNRRQLILEGPPGSGKTFIADAFGRYFSGNPLQGPRDEHMVVVQFHQSYGYEDFIQGIRPEVKADRHDPDNQPVTNGEGHLAYVLKDGIFKELCDIAATRPETEPFVILIDEINRGNISRIFGELLLLLEYRDDQVRLPYATSDQPNFSIPRNVYLLGTMNTADRSLAQIDYALRRRFYFYELSPIVDGQAPYLERWLCKQPFDESVKHEVLNLFLRLNERVKVELGEDFLVGHSYFMTSDIATEHGRERLWKRAILPLLEEYFYNRQNRDQLLNRFSLPQLKLDSAPVVDEGAVGA